MDEMNNAPEQSQPVNSQPVSQSATAPRQMSPAEEMLVMQRMDQELLGICNGINYMDCIGAVRTLAYICERGYAPVMLDHYLPGVCSGIDQVLVRVADPNYLNAVCQEAAQHPVLDRHPATKQFVERVQSQFRTAEVNARTYRGIVFGSMQELNEARAEEAEMEMIMRSTARDNMESVMAAIQRMNAFRTRLRDYYISVLNEWLDECDRAARTYHGMIYDTIEIRNAAEAEYQSNLEYVNSIDRSSEEAVKAAYDRLCADKYPSSDELKAELAAVLKAYDTQFRTVDGILLPTREEAAVSRRELEEITTLMPKADPEDEPALLEIKARLELMHPPVRDRYLNYINSLLASYDMRIRTFRGVVYDTREEAAALRSENDEAERIWSTVRADDEQSMFNAKAEMEKFTTFLKEENTARLDKMLTDLDTALRTFNGRLYPTREEASTAGAEYNEIAQMMSTLDPQDEQAILTARARVAEMTSEYGANALANLDNMWRAYDLNLRTYLNIVFDTREEAANARRTREEFYRMESTMDLFQPASVMALENYANSTLNEKMRPEALALIADLKDVLQNVNKVFTENSVNDPAADKKGSAEIYKQAEKLIPRMERYHLNTNGMHTVMERHYASLNPGQKMVAFFKGKKHGKQN